MVRFSKVVESIEKVLETSSSRRRNKNGQAEVIGVAGTEAGVGVTHFCLLSANYLTAAAGERTAVLEWNGSGDFVKMEQVCTGRVGKKKSYDVLGTDYYKEAGTAELAQCLEEYRYVLIDFGTIGTGNRTEFQCCQKRVLIGSFSEWQWETFWEFLKQDSEGKDKWIYAAAFGSMEVRKKVKQRLGISVLKIPLSADAFSVTPSTLEFFQKFFS